MAEGVVTDIAVNIFNSLSSSLIQKVASSWIAKEEFQRLKKNIEDIKPVLADAERRQYGSEAIKKWLASLQDVIYDADDLVDEISAEAKRLELMSNSRFKMAKKVRIFFSSSLNPLLFRIKLYGRVKEIREKLDEIRSTMIGFNFLLRDVKEEVIVNKREETVPFVREDDIIGRDDDKKSIIDMLLKTNECPENPSIISIVGIGGLGKTALAQLVYNDTIVQQTFEVKTWVCVSEDFNVKEIARKMVFGNNLSYEDLVSEVKEMYERKKYLIVLDDVWNEDSKKWSRLMAILPPGAPGSKIIVTTRSRRVADIMRSTVPMYELKGLAPDQCWTLFKKVSGQPELEGNVKLAHIGRQILKKCANVPLAIRTLGSLLYGKDVVEWSSINEHELTNIEQDDEDILPVLRISYNHLPSHLKNCFAMCAVFPKDYELDLKKLTYMCIAAGFLKPPNTNQSLEDVGEIAFLFLLRRCFFQDVLRDSDSGKIASFKMHDLIHDLAQQVAGKQAAHIFPNRTSTIDEEAIRYAAFLTESFFEFPCELLRAKKLRVLIIGLGYCSVYEIVSSFQSLRFVHLQFPHLRKLPSSIAMLKLLRFLDLSGNTLLKCLPDALVSLINLQMLNLDSCHSLEILPRNFEKFISLQHLIITRCETLIRNIRGGDVNSLFHCPFKWTRICNEGGTRMGSRSLNCHIIAGYLGNRQSLRPLFHVTIDYYRMLPDFKEKPTSIQLWQVKHWPHEYTWGLGQFPSSYHKLSEIRFSHCRYVRYFPKFARLPSLKILILQDMERIEYIDAFSTAEPFFPCLEELEVSHLPNLKAWSPRIEEIALENDGQHRHLLPSFPHLSVLSITDCPNLKYVPLIPHVTSLHLKDVNELLYQTLTVQRAEQHSSSFMVDSINSANN